MAALSPSTMACDAASYRRRMYEWMFSYLRQAPEPTGREDGLFVFGRADRRLATSAHSLFSPTLDEKHAFILVTGGVGRDSGGLDVAEAVYLQGELTDRHGIPEERILVEDQARNGGENCRLGLAKIISDRSHAPSCLLVIAHATSLRRLMACLEHESSEMGHTIALTGRAIDFEFDPNCRAHQLEAVDELLRLVEWPAKRWCTKQHDLPDELEKFAREEKARFLMEAQGGT